MRPLLICLALLALPLNTAARTHRISPGVRVYLSCPRLHRQLDRAPDQVVAPVLIRFHAVPRAAALSRLSLHGVELVGRADAPSVTAHLLNTLPVADLTVKDPPIEAVIDQIYQEGTA